MLMLLQTSKYHFQINNIKELIRVNVTYTAPYVVHGTAQSASHVGNSTSATLQLLREDYYLE